MINGHSSVIEANLIQDINWQQKLGGAESAGIKLHYAVDVLIRNNIVRRVFTTQTNDYSCHFGIWLDWANQGARVTGNLIYDVYGLNRNPQNWPLYLEANAGPVFVDNNIVIKHPENSCTDSYLKCLNCVFAHNLVFKGGIRHENDSERDFPWYEPHSFIFRGMSKDKGMPERNFNLNNIYMGDSYTNADKERKRNLFMPGDQQFTCTSTPDGAVISFVIDKDIELYPLISHETIGVFSPMNQGMTDRNGKPYDLDIDISGTTRAARVTAGPFAFLAKGKHQFVFSAGKAARTYISGKSKAN
jgi:hypothetical protein